MLVLSRKIGEEVVIGRVTCVRVLRVSGSRMFLAVEAPDTVSVDRKENWLAKEREHLAAGNGGSVSLNRAKEHASAWRFRSHGEAMPASGEAGRA